MEELAASINYNADMLYWSVKENRWPECNVYLGKLTLASRKLQLLLDSRDLQDAHVVIAECPGTN